MASDWLAPIAGAVVGVAGIAAGLLTSRATRRHDAEMERLRQREANQERRDQLVVDTYLDLLTMADHVGWWVSTVPDADNADTAEAPPFPVLDDQPRVRAKLAAFGSDEVQRRWAAYTVVAVMIRKHVEGAAQPDDGTGTSSNEGTTSSRGLTDEMRQSERNAMRALSDQIAKELGRRRRSTIPLPSWIYDSW